MPTLQALADLLRNKRFAVLTGAGCSTESGIPDYRGPETRKRARNPVRYNQFRDSAEWRKRYWARSLVGFSRVIEAEPNPGHTALAGLEAAGRLTGLVTQNVDGLHRKAGSDVLVELHGRLSEVVCLSCARLEPRPALQHRLQRLNPDWAATATDFAPDGDAELPEHVYANFRPAGCEACDGPLKPHVVFFGENVPRERVETAKHMVADADALLVVGSSLEVFSGLRFVKYAERDGIPVAILNLGPTRGDPMATLKVEGRSGELLPLLLHTLMGYGS